MCQYYVLITGELAWKIRSVERWGGRECGKEWKKFRDIVMECTNDVCGMRRVVGQRREGSERAMKKWVG